MITLSEFQTKFLRGRSLFHFTDERNVPSIRAHGLLSHAESARLKVHVAVPGGNDHSHEADAMFGVRDDVHLCYLDQHPMEYAAKQQGRLDRVRWLRVDPAVMSLSGVRFTLEVANKSGAGRMTDFAEAAAQYDLEALFGRLDWKSPDQMSRVLAARKYEILVPKRVELKFIQGL